MSDFVKCPRLYYLRNVYKDPVTRHKVNIINPSLALGQSVHEVLEALSMIPAEERFKTSLLTAYDNAWKKVSGKLGGFANEEEEAMTKERGARMLQRVIAHPGPLANKAIKITKDLPNYYLSEEENIVLCGKIDWLEYLPETDSVNIIDFKTGKNDESASSLQLPIYLLLVHNLQKRNVTKASYWYLDRDDEPVSIQLPNLEEAHQKDLKELISVPKEAVLAAVHLKKLLIIKRNLWALAATVKIFIFLKVNPHYLNNPLKKFCSTTTPDLKKTDIAWS
jgi:ATP-dependent helicase/DNAse subunit B